MHTEIHSNSCPVLDSNTCFSFVSHSRVDNADNYILYGVVYGDLCRKWYRFLYVLTNLNILQFLKQLVTKKFERFYGFNWRFIHKNNDEKSINIFLWNVISIKWYMLRIISPYCVRECQEMMGFRQWAWMIVSKDRQAPMNVRTSCMSANERWKVQLSVVQLPGCNCPTACGFHHLISPDQGPVSLRLKMS